MVNGGVNVDRGAFRSNLANDLLHNGSYVDNVRDYRDTLSISGDVSMDLDYKYCSPVYIKLLVDLMRPWGVSANDLLAGTGVAATDLTKPGMLLSLRQEMAIYERAEAISPRPEWALLAGQATSLQTHGVSGYAMLTSSDIRQVLHLSIRFHKLAGSAAGAELREKANGDYEVRIVDTINDPSLHHCVQEEFLSAFHKALVDVSGGALRPKSICLDYSAPGYSEVYSEIFACPVEFDAPHSAYLVDHADLSMRIPTWDTLTQEACRRQCEQILEQLTEAEDFVDHVRKILLLQPCDKRSADHVADRLHISTRNLRRKLEQESTSFQQVLDDVRCELAKNYLSTTTLRLEDIAPLLGFSETSNLRRAFKKWTAITPSEYRDSLRASI